MRIVTKRGNSPGSRRGATLPARRMEKSASSRSSVETDNWRHDNIGRLLNSAIRCFEARVLQLMTDAGHAETRLSHVSLTRNLDRSGTRITELARRAAMTKQAMGELVDQCVDLGLVARQRDPADGRARAVVFTRAGLAWLEDFRKAVGLAEQEMRQQIGSNQLDHIKHALTQYGARYDALRRER